MARIDSILEFLNPFNIIEQERNNELAHPDDLSTGVQFIPGEENSFDSRPWFRGPLLWALAGPSACSDQKFEDTNEKPTAIILEPTNGTTFYEGGEITFLGEGGDDEDDNDGILSDLRGIWSSNVDGILRICK